MVLTEDLIEEAEGTDLLLENISWRTYEEILRGLGKCRRRVTYDEGMLEIMTLSFEHESRGSLLGRLVETLTLVLGIAITSGKSTTLKKKLRKKGLEPDECYWIENAERMRGRKRWLAKRDPPPDLAIEIDITRSSLNRMRIYATLAVPEVWTFDGQVLKFFHLDRAAEKYREKSHSRAFPFLAAADLQRFLDRIGEQDETTWIRGFMDWVSVEILPTYAAKASRNGRK